MPKNYILAVIGESCFGAEIGHRAVGARHHWIGRLAMAVALQTFNIKSLVHLVPIGTYASKHAGGPRLAHRAHKKTLSSRRLEKCMIGSGQPECLAQ